MAGGVHHDSGNFGGQDDDIVVVGGKGADGFVHALKVDNAGAPVAAAPPTGVSSTQVQGTAARQAAVVGNPVFVQQVDRINGLGMAQTTFEDDKVALSAPYTLPATGVLLSSGANAVVARTPVIYKSTTATASGNTAVWTPTTGKKFRLMRFLLTMPSDVAKAAGADVAITFQDSATDMGLKLSVFVPAVAVTTGNGAWSSGWIDLGNGILSATINNVLNINLGAAITTSGITCMAAGTEE